MHAGDKLRQTFSMVVGDAGEAVTVTAGDSALLQVESAAIKDTIEQQKVIDLPLKGRSFIDLVGLSPGVSIPPAGTRGSALAQTGLVFGILGQRTGHNLYLVDGVSVTDEAFNNLVLSPSARLDIQEVSINQTSYDAEFGGKSGGVINVITRSGGNRFHGSVFEFVRNDIFDAKNFFASSTLPIPPFKQNQFGASFGGPIQKDKTFFFLDYEGLRVRKGQTQLFNVPTALERTGNFTGSGITVNMPGTTTPFPNDTIPTIDPVAAAELAVVPLPTPGLTGANNLRATGISSIGVNQYNARLDHTFNSKDSIFIRGSIFDDNEFDPFGSGVLNEALLPGFGYNLRTHTDNISASWNHVFSPSWINEVRFGYMWVGGGQVSPNAGINFAGPTGLQGVTSNPLDTGFPQATITGFSTMGESTQYVQRVDTDYEAYDNALWHHGNHTVKFGGYFMHLDFDPINAQNARGTFGFTGRYTGNALGGFPFLGNPNSGFGWTGRSRSIAGTQMNWMHLYIEDGWQITSSLKLDIGLRYEYNQGVTDANNNMAIINTLVPGGEYVIASDNQGNISPAASALLSTIPIPHITSSTSRLGPQPARDATLPRGTEGRTRLGIARPQDRAPRRVWYLYQPSGVQHHSKRRSEPAVLFCQVSDCSPARELRSQSPQQRIFLTAKPNGHQAQRITFNHDFKIEYNNVWNLSVQHSFSSSTSFEAQYIGSYTVHAG